MATPQTSSLKNLPAELRIRIYEYAVVETEPVQIITLNRGKAVGAQQPPLSKANHQIRSEVLPIYYAENTFMLEITDVECACCSPITPMVWNRATHWIRSCGAYISSVARVGAACETYTESGEKIGCRLVAGIERDGNAIAKPRKGEKVVSITLHNLGNGRCTCTLSAHTITRKKRHADKSFVLAAMEQCFEELFNARDSKGYWCRYCGGDSPPAPFNEHIFRP